MQDAVLKIIIKELKGWGITALKVILFGSRARNDFRTDSDWDFLVIVDKEMNFQRKRKINMALHRQFAKFDDTIEILLKSKTDFEKMKKYIGTLSHEANLEGKILWMK